MEQEQTQYGNSYPTNDCDNGLFHNSVLMMPNDPKLSHDDREPVNERKQNEK